MSAHRILSWALNRPHEPLFFAAFVALTCWSLTL